jgi:hypothetical protein
MQPFALLVGRTADSWGRKPLFLFGFAILPIRAVLYTLSDNSFWLIGVQLRRVRTTTHRSRCARGCSTWPSMESCRHNSWTSDVRQPFLRGEDVKRWHVEPDHLFLINTPKGKVDIDAYPAIRDWLLPFKPDLEKRARPRLWRGR